MWTEAGQKLLNKNGILITQATSPFFAKIAFCSILKTVASAGFYVYPLKMEVPTFGELGFVLAAKQKLDIPKQILAQFDERKTNYLTKELALAAFFMEKGFSCQGVKINSLRKLTLLDYYQSKLWELY